MDNEGRIIWDKTFGGKEYDGPDSISMTNDGGFIVAATTKSKGAGENDLWVLRFDKAGNLLWDKTYGGKEYDSASNLISLKTGGFMLAGSTRSRGSGGLDFILVRLDANGKSLWTKTYGGKTDDILTSISLLGNGDIGVAGWAKTKSKGERGRVIRLDQDGKKIWEKTIGSPRGGTFRDITETISGDLFLVGYAEHRSGHYKPWLVKLDANGKLIYDKKYTIKGSGDIRSIVKLRNGQHTIVVDIDQVKSELWIARIGTNGAMKNPIPYHGESGDSANKIIALPLGGLAIVGGRDKKAWLLALPGDETPVTAAQ